MFKSKNMKSILAYAERMHSELVKNHTQFVRDNSKDRRISALFSELVELADARDRFDLFSEEEQAITSEIGAIYNEIATLEEEV